VSGAGFARGTNRNQTGLKFVEGGTGEEETVKAIELDIRHGKGRLLLYHERRMRNRDPPLQKERTEEGSQGVTGEEAWSWSFKLQKLRKGSWG